MEKIISCVGREEELLQIGTLIKQRKTSDVCCITISAPGGIGKTRLLEETKTRFHNTIHTGSEVFVAEIIDFDDIEVQSPGALRRKLATTLDRTAFALYIQSMLDWRKLELSGATSDLLYQKTLDDHKVFVDCFNVFSKDRIVVLLFDTVEKIDDTEIANYLLDLIQDFQNTVVILSGRDEESTSIFDVVKKHFESKMWSFELQPLNSQAQLEYLELKQQSLRVSIRPELAEKILLFSEGRPIIIDLAVESLACDLPLDWIAENDTARLQSLPDEKREEFEKKLMGNIRRLQGLGDQIVPTMAHVFPIDSSLAQHLLIPNAHECIQRAKEFVFVKTRSNDTIWLHDEVRRMVNQYVWPEIDPDSSRRRWISTRAAQFFKERIEELDNKIRIATMGDDTHETLQRKDDLIREKEAFSYAWLQQALNIGLNEGITVYEHLVEESRREHHRRLSVKLESMMKRYLRDLGNGLNYEQKYRLEIVKGKLLKDAGPSSANEARELFYRLLEENKGDNHRLAVIYNLLGSSELNLGNFTEAIEYEHESLRLYQETNQKNATVIVQDFIGYIYQLRGDWEKALDYYKRALDIIYEMETRNPQALAKIFRDLGYALGLLGKYTDAIHYCEMAIEIYNRFGLDKEIIRTEVAMATIYRDKASDDQPEYYIRAIDLLQKALASLKEPDDYEQLIRVHFKLAWTLWFQGDYFRDSKKDIQLARGVWIQAREHFEKARELSENYYFWIELPGILHQASNIYWRLGDKETARKWNEQAHNVSKQYNDIRYAIDSLVGFAEYDFDEGKYEQIDEYARELQKQYEEKGYKFPLFYGRMRRIQAAIAFQRGEYDASLKGHAIGIAQISQHGGYGMYMITKELNMLKEKIVELPKLDAERWLRYLRGYWNENADPEKRGQLVSWCDAQLMRNLDI